MPTRPSGCARRREALERQLREPARPPPDHRVDPATLDTRRVLEQITDRLGRPRPLATTSRSRSSTARAACSTRCRPRASTPPSTSNPGIRARTGIATWVVEPQRTAVLIVDEATDPRVNQFRGTGAVDGSLIVRPAARPRRGDRRAHPRAPRAANDRYQPRTSSSWSSCSRPRSRSPSRTPRSFQASRSGPDRDDLTGLLNHGTFQEGLEPRASARASRSA